MVLVQDFERFVYEVDLHELNDRDIDVEAVDIDIGINLFSHLFVSFVDEYQANRIDEAGVFGDGNELSRRDVAEPFVVEAEENFACAELLFFDAEKRLNK